MKKLLIIVMSLILCISSFSMNVYGKDNILINTHSTMQRTKGEIINYYKKHNTPYDYQKSIFKTEPSITAPYKAGNLTQEFTDFYLEQVNLFRWMSGLSSVEVNTKYMDRSQKGAVIQAANNTLSHYPIQPDDMDDSFYEEAYKGTSAEIGYSTNCAYTYNPSGTVQSYIDDVANVNAGVGHRSSFLDIDAKSVSFGFASRKSTYSTYYYNATSVHTDYALNKNNESFYAWPTSGYMPVELIHSAASWSIRVNDNIIGIKPAITLTYNNKTYNAEELLYAYYYNTYSFKLPEELRSLIKDNAEFKPNTTVQVTMTGLQDRNGNTITIQYPVKFFSVNNRGIFTDVSENQWYYDTVYEAYDLGLMTGATETLFKPNANMNRAMVSCVFHRMEGAPKTTYKALFSDVKSGQYYSLPITWAKQKGVINGYKDGTFKPLKNVTREEMATMLFNFAKYKGKYKAANTDLTKFKDYKTVTKYAVDPVKWAVANGLMSGKDNGTRLDPKGTATRAECAKMLLQGYKLFYKK